MMLSRVISLEQLLLAGERRAMLGSGGELGGLCGSPAGVAGPAQKHVGEGGAPPGAGFVQQYARAVCLVWVAASITQPPAEVLATGPSWTQPRRAPLHTVGRSRERNSWQNVL